MGMNIVDKCSCKFGQVHFFLGVIVYFISSKWMNVRNDTYQNMDQNDITNVVINSKNNVIR